MEITLRSQIAVLIILALLAVPLCAAGNELGLVPYNHPSTNSKAAVYLLIPDMFETPAVFDLGGIGLAAYLKDKKRIVYLLDWKKPGQDIIKGSFDDLVGRGLPVAIRTLKDKVGDRPVVLIGHGLGGLAALVYAANENADVQPAAVVAVGTPGKFVMGNKIFDAMIEAEKNYPPEKAIPTAMGAKAPAPFSGATKSMFDILLTNDKNFDPAAREGYYLNALVPISRLLARQLIQWVQSGQTKSTDGQIDYFNQLSKVTCPVLFIAGKIDNLVDPYESILAKEQIGSKDKSMRIFCIPNGYKSDYGHVGLLLGPNTDREVFPYIFKWTKKRTR